MYEYKPFDEYSTAERASMLVNGIMNQDLPQEVRERVWNWFKSGVSEEEKYEVFAGLIHGLKENAQPDEYDEWKMRELHDILGLPYEDKCETKQPKIIKNNLRRRLAIRVAAVVIPAVMITGGGYFLLKRAHNIVETPVISMITVSTTTGEQKHLIMPDSSQVWLNESSTLIYCADFNTNREVNLRGEAYFWVKNAAGTTFSVKAGGLNAIVTGTKFNVKAYTQNSETELTLYEGSIKAEVARQTFDMQPHDRLLISNLNDFVQLQNNTDAECTWRCGMDFYNNQLHEILSAIALRFNKELEVSGELPDDYVRFGFDYDMTLHSILGVLENANPHFSFEISSQKLKITTNR